MIKQKGFTLIEVLLAITILATLMVLAGQTLKRASQHKVRIQAQVDDVSRMRDFLRLVDRDINLAYHHYDFEKAIYDEAKKKQKASANQVGAKGPGTTNPSGVNPPGFTGDASTPPSTTVAEEPEPPREAPRQDPSTFFVGAEHSLDFVTLNNGRTIRNEKQSDMIEVGYSLKDCKSSDGKKTSKCIWRRSSPVVDEDVTKGGDEIVVLEDVTEFSLKYIGKGKQDWVKDWNSGPGGDGATRNNFPQAVEISITIEKGEEGKKKKYSSQIVSSLHFPNNQETKK